MPTAAPPYSVGTQPDVAERVVVKRDIDDRQAVAGTSVNLQAIRLHAAVTSDHRNSSSGLGACTPNTAGIAQRMGPRFVAEMSVRVT